VWSVWFIWLVSFNQQARQTRQTKQRSSYAGGLFQHPASAEASVKMLLENWVSGRARIAGAGSGSRLLGEKKTVNA
jgi:hypothetical protein